MTGERLRPPSSAFPPREKEVTVYCKVIGEAVVLLTVKARDGQSSQKG